MNLSHLAQFKHCLGSFRSLRALLRCLRLAAIDPGAWDPLEEFCALLPELLAHARVDDDVGGRVEGDEEGRHGLEGLQLDGIRVGVAN